MLQKLWYDRPVRTQLLVAVGLINLLAAVVAVSVSILNTRTATRVEIEASLEVAQRFVNATIKDLAAQGHFEQLEQLLPLQLKHLRHVRIMFMDPSGQLTVVSPADESAKPHAPNWFAALVRPQLVGRAVRVVTAEGVNPVVIVGEPADEIAEAWQDFYSLAIVWLTLDALILVVLYIVLGRVLDPLQSLSRGMARPGGWPLRDAPADGEGQGACRPHQPLQHACRGARRPRGKQRPLPATDLSAGGGAARDRQRAA